MKTILHLTLLAYAAALGHAAGLHVAINGDDKNPGTKSFPLRTIQRAAELAQPGDTVTVHAGIYRERVNPPRGGTSDEKRVVFQAAPGEDVVITGSEPATGWTKDTNDTWRLVVPNSLFGDFNPYNDLIRGDWFEDKGRPHHTGAVYLNGAWLKEAAEKEEIMRPAAQNDPLWFAEVNDVTTEIWAQFPGVDPNGEAVEINVRKTVFYPEKPFINYITVRGFKMRNAATNWAPPSAEQKAVIGTHWSKGWVIEDNIVSHSKCTGISLGKYGDEHDNMTSDTAEGYVATIRRALDFGWNKETIGGHIVRNNTVSNCEQAGIVGSMGCAFSVIEGNVIHDIHVHRLFDGHEQAGIKFHGAIDTRIANNRIFNTNLGLWLDWMTQGTRVEGNLFHDNTQDVFLEVNHGPLLVANNIMLSPSSMRMNSSGVVIAHNIISGTIDATAFDSRITPYHKAHSTEIAGMHDNPGGDVRFFNNLFVKRGDPSQYGMMLLPVLFQGNVFTNGTVMPMPGKTTKLKFEGMNRKGAKEQLKKYTQQDAVVQNSLLAMDFDAAVNLSQSDSKAILEISIDKKWLTKKRESVTSAILPTAVIPDLPYVNPDGSPVTIDTDYFGNQRNIKNPSPGPFEITKGGKQSLQVWPLKR